MKKWLFYPLAVILAAALGYMPFSGSDVATLQPAELLYVDMANGVITVSTDTGAAGKGQTLPQALADMKATASGEIFLDTVDHLLITDGARSLVQELSHSLRPACNICIGPRQTDLKKTAEFLRTKSDTVTLQQYLAGQDSIPRIVTEEERLRIVSE